MRNPTHVACSCGGLKWHKAKECLPCSKLSRPKEFKDVTLEDLLGRATRDGDCLIFSTGAGTGNPYPRIRVNGKTIHAHRHVYALVNGPILKGLHIHHLCEQKHCINPKHLQALTMKEHQKAHFQRLSDQDVSVIRGAVKELAERFGVSVYTVSQIGTGLKRNAD